MTKSKDTFPEDSFHAGAMYDFFKPRAEGLEWYDFEPSKTRQEFAEDCDINSIMARYEVTGQLPQSAVMPTFADYVGVPNLMEALELMSNAQAAFMTLPAKVRREFDNDPTEFVAFASDPGNLDQMRDWGLAAPAPQEPPTVAPAAYPAPSAPSGSSPLPEPPKPV